MALAFGQVQSKLTAEPEPSFAEDALSNHRHPGLDTDVFLYINHWRNSAARTRATAGSSSATS